MSQFHEDLISVDEARTLDGLFARRVHRSGPLPAYTHYSRSRRDWVTHTWDEMAAAVARWQQALLGEALLPGDRVAVQLRNCPEWVMFDQAALSLGLVTVPLYTDDRPDNIAYILGETAVQLLVVQDAGRWRRLAPAVPDHGGLRRVVIIDGDADAARSASDDERVRLAGTWLPASGGALRVRRDADPQALATIMYTSGTTGRPKGVMLSHHSILAVAHAALTLIDCYAQDLFLSFLPLSHALERTGGYYLPVMAGARVAYARSVTQLAEDLQRIRPSVLIAVPRVFERVYGRLNDRLETQSLWVRRLFRLAIAVGWARFEHRQGRAGWRPGHMLWPLLDRLVAAKVAAGFGGHLRVAVSGGAPLSAEIARAFIGLGLPLVQGYGLTEASPVVSVNPLEDNEPASVGKPIRGTRVRIGDQGELLVQGPGVMLGYWNDHAATAAVVTADGWLRTGDQARIGERGHIYITGRLKDVLVLSNGEKIAPADLEGAIAMDPLFAQVLVIGEGRPYLTALIVLDGEHWPAVAQVLGLDPLDPASPQDERLHALVLRRIRDALRGFPGYAKVRRVHLTLEPWTSEDGLATLTFKIRRPQVLARYADAVESMYTDGPAG